jgi:hypothetical protein
MNRALKLSLAASLLLFTGTAFAQSSPQQPLGDYARAVRKSKGAPSTSDQAATASKQKKVYENDTMPTTSSLSVVGNTEASSSQPSQDASASSQPGSSLGSTDDKKGEKKDDPKIKPGQSVEERKQAYDAWKQKLDAQNEKITKLSHDLDLLQREYNVKAAEFYSDTANRAQNPTGFAKQDADYKQQLTEKQQAVDAAKAQMNDMQESARKAGVPSSVTEQH